MMVLGRFKKYGIGNLHQHIHTLINYIADVTFEITNVNKKEILTIGDSFFVLSNPLVTIILLELIATNGLKYFV